MNTKLKTCGICEKEFPRLWKAKTREHPAMCQSCWTAYKAPESDDHDKVKAKAVQKKKRSPIAPISAKKAKELVKYRKLRDEYMRANPVCEVCGSRKNLTLHHKKSRQFFLCDVSVFMVACFTCHEKIHREHKWAEENGYIESKL